MTRTDRAPSARRGRMRQPTTVVVCAVLAAAAAGCGNDDNPVTPASTASVTVTSPIGARIAVDRTVQLSAAARDASGGALSGRSFTWSSSTPTVASVDAAGSVQALDAGPVTISATADGVSGQLALEVVEVDLVAIGALLDDPWTDQIVAALSAPAQGLVQDALDACSAAMGTGDVDALEGCLTDVTQATSSDPTDGVLLALTALIAGRSQQHVDLQTD